MPYSVLHGDFRMNNNDYIHHKGVHIFKCAVDVSFIDFIMSSNEVIPFVLHIMYNACKVITQ